MLLFLYPAFTVDVAIHPRPVTLFVFPPVPHGLQVLVGLLKLPPEDAHRGRRNTPPAELARQAAEFRTMWDPYDWTKQLNDA